MFDKIPTVLTADEIINKAFKRANKVEMPKDKDRLVKVKNLSLTKVNVVGDVTMAVLKKYIDKFPRAQYLHPFYKSLLDILVDYNEYKKSLGNVNWCCENIETLTEKMRNKIKKSKDIKLIDSHRRAYYGRIASFLKRIDNSLKYLNDSRNILRKLYSINTEEPTIVIAGYPNVGKSQLISNMSSAKPTIAQYPFTTKGIVLGHYVRDDKKYQIMDTPGLLFRKKKNEIEKQAEAALKHIADVVIFLIDPTGTCEYPLNIQMKLYEYVKEIFDMQIILVENKLDIFKGNSNNMKISSLTGENVDILINKVIDIIEKENEDAGER